jgi:protein ImuB
MKAERMLCLWCPDWPVVAARRADPSLAGVPVVVLDRGFVLAASVEARAEGVRRGLRRREAESRCPGLALRPVDTAGEARAFEALSRAVEVLAPRLALDRPGLLNVATRGPSRYFGGDEAFATRLLTEVTGVGGADVRIGVADGVFAARLAARRAEPGGAFVVPAGESAAFLAPWPVRTLDDDNLASLLVRLGLPTLGDFAGLPEASVLGRFGLSGLGAHRRARGEDEYPPSLLVPPPELELHHEFDPPVSRVDTAVFAGRALAGRLLTELAADGLICTRVRVEAETEHGERLARTWRLSGHTGVRGSTGGAGSSPGSTILAERVRGQLEAWVTKDEGSGRADVGRSADDDLVTSGLTLLRLVPEEVVVAGRSQLGLWGGDRAAAERAGRALVRLQSLLGPEAVTTPVLQGGRTPDEQIAWIPWGDDPPPPSDQSRPPTPPERLDSYGDLSATNIQTSAGWPGAVPPPAPAIVFRPARAAELLDAGGRPVVVSGRGEASAAPERLNSPALPRGGGPVETWAGPWVQDLRWWDPETRRRRALWQIVAAGVACLVSVESGEAYVEAVYD